MLVITEIYIPSLHRTSSGLRALHDGIQVHLAKDVHERGEAMCFVPEISTAAIIEQQLFHPRALFSMTTNTGLFFSSTLTISFFFSDRKRFLL